MINYRYSILSIKERDRIMNSFFSEKNITADFSLNIDEIHRIKRFNKPYISLGYALQYLFLKARGISVLNSYELIPKNITDYVSDQINCSSKHLNKYWAVTNTKSRNFQEITKDLNYSRGSVRKMRITYVKDFYPTDINAFNNSIYLKVLKNPTCLFHLS